MRAGLFPTSPSSLVTFGIRGILDGSFGADASDSEFALPFWGRSTSSDRCLFCGGSLVCIEAAGSPFAGEADLCRFRELEVGDMSLSFAWMGEAVLLFEPFEMTSSVTVSGISVNLSRAGSYATDDLRRAGARASLSGCGCGSMMTKWCTAVESGWAEMSIVCASSAPLPPQHTVQVKLSVF